MRLLVINKQYNNEWLIYVLSLIDDLVYRCYHGYSVPRDTVVISSNYTLGDEAWFEAWSLFLRSSKSTRITALNVNTIESFVWRWWGGGGGGGQVVHYVEIYYI